jgi:hypothetical protein
MALPKQAFEVTFVTILPHVKQYFVACQATAYSTDRNNTNVSSKLLVIFLIVEILLIKRALFIGHLNFELTRFYCTKLICIVAIRVYLSNFLLIIY